MDAHTLAQVISSIEQALTQLSQGVTRRVDVTLMNGTTVKVYKVGEMIRIDIGAV